jgi:glycosyltransferase involved in cell wall biosynthesis
LTAAGRHGSDRLPGTRRLKLLFVTDEMEVGGTQRQLTALAKGLDPAGFAPELVYFRNSSFLVDELRAAKVPVRKLPKRRRVDLRFFLTLRAALRSGGYDVVHCASFTAETWTALARGRAARPALVSTVRGTYEWYSRAQWWIKKGVARASCRVVANSLAGARYAASRMGVPDSAIDVVYNGIELPPGAAPRPPRAQLGLPGAATLALFVGRLVDHKNLASLLRAAARLRDLAGSLQIVLVGDGPLRAELQSLGARLGVDGMVRWLGARQDARALIAEADLLVLSSFREGLSNAILEAMAAGRPVVASDVGGNPELVVHGETGLLYPSDDDGALAAALRALAGDPERRRRMGEAGRARARELFSMPAMVGRMERIYRECAARPAAGCGSC